MHDGMVVLHIVGTEAAGHGVKAHFLFGVLCMTCLALCWRDYTTLVS